MADFNVSRLRLEQLEQRLEERLHGFETRVLSALFQLQEHNDARMDELSQAMTNFTDRWGHRMDTLEQRVSETERKILESGR